MHCCSRDASYYRILLRSAVADEGTVTAMRRRMRGESMRNSRDAGVQVPVATTALIGRILIIPDPHLDLTYRNP